MVTSGGARNAAVRSVTTATLGLVLVLTGLAFHALAAYYRPSGPHALSPDTDWAVLEWGWMRLVAGAAVAGGAWLVAVALTTRDR